jgi:lambda repressor-like predicted transcriptional regulator
MKAWRYLPWAPVERYLPQANTPAGRGGISEMARRTGVARRVLSRCRRVGYVSIRHADMIADGLGVHAADIWGADYYEPQRIARLYGGAA